MPKYKATVYYNRIQSVSLDMVVEADDAEEAEKLATKSIFDGADTPGVTNWESSAEAGGEVVDGSYAEIEEITPPQG
jgi:hypothetical protein